MSSLSHICVLTSNSQVKDNLQWKNDLGLYFSLVLVMKIGMYDLVIFRLVQGFNTLRFLTSHDVTSGIRTYTFVWKCMEIRVLLGLSANKEAYWSTFVFLSSNTVPLNSNLTLARVQSTSALHVSSKTRE